MNTIPIPTQGTNMKVSAVYVSTIVIIFDPERKRNSIVISEAHDNYQDAQKWEKSNTASYRRPHPDHPTVEIKGEGVAAIITKTNRSQIIADNLEPFFQNYRVKVRRTLINEIWMDIDGVEDEGEAESKAEMYAEDVDWDDEIDYSDARSHSAEYEVVEMKEVDENNEYS